MSGRRDRRHEELFPAARDDLVRLAGEAMSACRRAQYKLRPFGPHYKAVDAFAEAARTLAGVITGGEVTFITPLHSSGPSAAGEQPEAGCARRARELDDDVADAIAFHGGDAVAAVRAVMILTRFLEDERERLGPAPTSSRCSEAKHCG